jgi:hypothetical protein
MTFINLLTVNTETGAVRKVELPGHPISYPISRTETTCIWEIKSAALNEAERLFLLTWISFFPAGISK